LPRPCADGDPVAAAETSLRPEQPDAACGEQRADELQRIDEAEYGR
jgi:hypothetical protein